MTITRRDLKIFKPERGGSGEAAGGQRTRNALTSGKLNDLFPAISDVDHARSAIDIAKAFPALDTTGVETLIDAHVFISEPTLDPLVHHCMVESPVLSDSDRMPQMIEILESSVNAGEEIRKGGPGFLVNQNSFSSDYLQSAYEWNGRDYWKTTYLQPGQVICITVEYPGIESATWPRKTHFCKVVRTSIVGGQVGTVVFEPPIPFATPEASVTINGANNCTRIRHANSASPLKFYGVTRLTADSSGANLSVGETSLSLLPAIYTEQPMPGNTITGGSDGSGDAAVSSVVRKVLSQPTAEGSFTYVFSTPDLLTDTDGICAIATAPTAQFLNNPYWVQEVTVGAGTVTITLRDSASPTASRVAALYYVSSYRYALYSSSNAMPANKQLVVGSIKGRVVFADSNYAPQDVFERSGESSGKLYDGTEHLATVDYLTGVVTKQSVSRGDFNLTYGALVETTSVAEAGDTSATFALVAANPRLESFYVQAERISDRVMISASSDASGLVTGLGIEGTISGGIVSLSFSAAVDLSTLRYDIIEQVRKLPPAELYGLNPLRIPNDGVVDIFREWDTVALQHTLTQQISTPASGQVLNVRQNSQIVDITDAEGKSLWTLENTHYTVNSSAGTVTINSTFEGFTAPFLLTDSVGELALVSAKTDSGITLAKPLSRVYPAGSTVASVLVLGDLQAAVGPVRDMTSWENNWDLDGAPATGNLNVVDFPIEVNNRDGVNEDWVLIMTSATAFRCVGKRIGQIASGDTLSDFAPINPVTNAPYFVIRAGAFGGGWQNGEAIRFETFAAAKPIMMLRIIEAGHSQISLDRAVLAFRGNES